MYGIFDQINHSYFSDIISLNRNGVNFTFQLIVREKKKLIRDLISYTYKFEI